MKPIERKTKGEILSQDWKTIQQLSERELRSQLRTLNDVANKRLQRLEQAGVDSPAMVGRGEKGKFTVPREATKQELQKSLSEVSDFIQQKTSSVKAARSYTESANELADTMGFDQTKAGRKAMWDIIDKFKETYPDKASQWGSDKIHQQIADIVAETGYADPQHIMSIMSDENEYDDDFDLFDDTTDELMDYDF